NREEDLLPRRVTSRFSSGGDDLFFFQAGDGIREGHVTGVQTCALPISFRVTKVRLAEAIKAGQAGVVGGRGSLRVLSMIAAAEIATILVLSTGAGLMLQSFWKLRYRGLGFQPDRLVVATLNLSASAYRSKARQS